MKRVALAVLVAVAVFPKDSTAQTCIGGSDLGSGLVQFGVVGVAADGVRGLGPHVRIGVPDLFLGGSYLTVDDGTGYQWPLVELRGGISSPIGRDAELCPTLRFLHQTVSDEFGDVAVSAWTFALALGSTAALSPEAAVSAFLLAGYQRVHVEASFSGASGAAAEGSPVVGLGIGLQPARNLRITGELSKPIRIDSVVTFEFVLSVRVF